MTHKNIKGFSLVEMAAVLIIIGIIITGIVSGQELVRTSRLNAILTDMQNYLIAVNKFKDEFQGLPGDINRATTLWDTTDDGDSDNRISTYDTEGLDAWEHLADSSYIQGSYPGRDENATATDADAVVVGRDVPRASLDNTGFWLLYEVTTDGYAYEDGNYLKYAAPNGSHPIAGIGSGTGNALEGALTPEDARTIDIKMDDGVSGTGDIFAVNGYTPETNGSVAECIEDVGAIENYLLTNNEITCQLWAIIR